MTDRLRIPPAKSTPIARAVPCVAALSLAACAPASGPPSAAPAPASAASAQASAAATAPAPGRPQSPDERAEALLARMTLDEKIDYIGGDRDFYIRAIPRLGIPEIKMSDGPSGCRNWGPSTAYTAAVGLAASFDPGLAERVGASIGRDCRARGVHILLAPGVNIQRSPLNGRNFEYLGEDPFLAGKTAAAYIRGLQSQGVLATVKHFAANNEEWDRHNISSEVDERTLREIYFPAFERAVREGHVGAAMTAYNLLNGVHCSENPWLIREVLEKEWGFPGFVMSDWVSVYDAAGAANGGLDLEMPSGKFMNRANLLPLIQSHKVDVATIDDKVRRILRTIIAAGFLDEAQQRRDDVPLDDPQSASVALDEARRSVVLLKNANGVLPLDRTKIKRIAVIGPNAIPAVWGGSGSAFVTPFHAKSLLEGVTRAAGAIEVDYHPGVRKSSDFALLGRPAFDGGLRQDIFAGRDLAGNPVATSTVDRIDFMPRVGTSPAPGVPAENYSIRWSGAVNVAKAGKYRILTNSDDGIRVFLDRNLVIDDWHDHAQTTHRAVVDLKPGPHAIAVEYYQGTGGAAAQVGFGPDVDANALTGAEEVAAIARRADAVIVAVGYGQSADSNSWGTPFEPFWPPPWAREGGLVESEESDRPFELPPPQVETLRQALAANPRTIVVLNSGGGVDPKAFADRAAALVWAGYPGQEGGQALAEILFGDVAPSAKLPVTFAKRYADYPSAASYNVDRDKKTPYAEGIFVGYRGFDANRVDPQFPFGFGLTYTTFDYAGLDAVARPDGSVAVSLNVTNKGKRAGEEIVQIYVAPPKGATPRAPKTLGGYARVALAAGETKPVSVVLEPRAFAYWDEKGRGWSVPAGTYEIEAAASALDIRLRHNVDVAARVLPP